MLTEYAYDVATPSCSDSRTPSVDAKPGTATKVAVSRSHGTVVSRRTLCRSPFLYYFCRRRALVARKGLGTGFVYPHG
jgi:hypothetical protein